MWDKCEQNLNANKVLAMQMWIMQCKRADTYNGYIQKMSELYLDGHRMSGI